MHCFTGGNRSFGRRAHFLEVSYKCFSLSVFRSCLHYWLCFLQIFGWSFACLRAYLLRRPSLWFEDHSLLLP